MNELAARRKL